MSTESALALGAIVGAFIAFGGVLFWVDLYARGYGH